MELSDVVQTPVAVTEPEKKVSKKKTGASKHDMIKVRVWLGADHCYILSRYLISRMLSVARIPQAKATKIALELKKQLVDEGKLDVQQVELEAALFAIMHFKGFGEPHVACYRLVSRFMAARQPLVLLLCGAPWTGKSSIAQQLAVRLNMPNVMRTSLICDMVRAAHLAPLAPTPLCARPGLDSPDALLTEYHRECDVVLQALQSELRKALSEGKPLILEGSHLDPGLLLSYLGPHGVVLLPALSTGGTDATSALPPATSAPDDPYGDPPPMEQDAGTLGVGPDMAAAGGQAGADVAEACAPDPDMPPLEACTSPPATSTQTDLGSAAPSRATPLQADVLCPASADVASPLGHLAALLPPRPAGTPPPRPPLPRNASARASSQPQASSGGVSSPPGLRLRSSVDLGKLFSGGSPMRVVRMTSVGPGSPPPRPYSAETDAVRRAASMPGLDGSVVSPSARASAGGAGIPSAPRVSHLGGDQLMPPASGQRASRSASCSGATTAVSVMPGASCSNAAASMPAGGRAVQGLGRAHSSTRGDAYDNTGETGGSGAGATPLYPSPDPCALPSTSTQGESAGCEEGGLGDVCGPGAWAGVGSVSRDAEQQEQALRGVGDPVVVPFTPALPGGGGGVQAPQRPQLPALILPVVLQVPRQEDHALIAADRCPWFSAGGGGGATSAGFAPQGSGYQASAGFGGGPAMSGGRVVLFPPATGLPASVATPSLPLDSGPQGGVVPARCEREVAAAQGSGNADSHARCARVSATPQRLDPTGEAEAVVSGHTTHAQQASIQQDESLQGAGTGARACDEAGGAQDDASRQESVQGSGAGDGRGLSTGAPGVPHDPGPVAGGSGGACGHDNPTPQVAQQQQQPVSPAEQLARARMLQDHLADYEAQGVPVVPVRYGAFHEAVDELHEYVLAAITTAMDWLEHGGQDAMLGAPLDTVQEQ